ncbi:RDD family protein [Dyella flagellata]|nr:RDD family protein [Dyella flagellata]
METNPYAAPGAVVDDSRVFKGNDLEARKASRGQRLGAVLLDGLGFCICLLPFFIEGYTGYLARAHGHPTKASTSSIYAATGGVLALGLLIFNLVLLHRSGQTVGKRMLGIKIVRTDGNPATLLRIIFLRWFPIGVLGRIPLVGPLVALANVLVIFGSERRCIHDYIADTIVIVD